MILMLFLRAVEYRLAAHAAETRFLWYFYYVPIILIPTLFLLSSIRLCYPHGEKRKLENGLLITAFLLTAGMLTNDLHFFAFVPSGIPLRTSSAKQAHMSAGFCSMLRIHGAVSAYWQASDSCSGQHGYAMTSKKRLFRSASFCYWLQ